MAELITVDDVLAFAKIVPGDEQLDLVPGFIAAARQQWERDTDTIVLDPADPLAKQAILILAAHYYTQRDLAMVGATVQTTPSGYAEMVRVSRVEWLA